ncbi:MAG: protease inhibitor I42 family protein [Xanthomonadales bacterium]|nr:protease inhibitor I42 family protein [Xanthomonadales bacterium]
MSEHATARAPAIALAGLLAAGVAGAAEIDLIAHAPDRPVEAVVGDVLAVRLQGNASTGYAWQRIDEDRAVLVQQRSSGVAAKPERPPAIGAATIAVWRFRAERVGDVELRFVYRQPWREGVPPARELAWRVHVRAVP